MQIELNQDEIDLITYCIGVTRGVLYGGITREIDEEIKSLLTTHMSEFNSVTKNILEKFLVQ